MLQGPAMIMYDYKNEKKNLQKSTQNEAQSELANHIVVQLKSSYNQLLEEPLPDNIERLLAELNKRERNS
jgi:hypothetical protein